MNVPNSPWREGFAPRYVPILPIYAAEHIPFVDILDAFVAAFPNANTLPNNLTWGINPANGHPGVFSTHFFGVKAADYLEKNYSSILGHRSQPPPIPRVSINDWMPANLAILERTENRVTFTWPANDDWMLRMPIGKSHVLLCLDIPAAVGGIRVAGPNLSRIEAYATAVEADYGCDVSLIHALSALPGPAASWHIESEPWARTFNTLRLVAEFNGPDRTVTVELNP
jgi:hypothetical protein